MDTRSIGWLALAGLLGGCVVDDGRPDDGGQSGTAVPDGCYEDHRVVVDDLAVPMDGFTRSAAEAIAEVAGLWVGSGEVGSDPAEVTFEVAHDGGLVEAVYLEYHQGGVGGTMGAEPATTMTCEPYYAFGVATSLDLSPWVAGEGAGEVMRTMGQQLWFTAETPIDDVTGTSAPSFDTTDWDRTVLASSFTLASDGTATLDVAWWGINDTETNARSTATASTGTIEPSGTTEPIASFQGLTRNP